MAPVFPLPVPQSALLPYRIENDQLSVLLITNANGNKWIIPKGNLEYGMTPEESAAVEAYEEAGVLVAVPPHMLGHWSYQKRGIQYRVSVFPAHVEEVLDHWLEEAGRLRRWFSIEKALLQVSDKSLQQVIKLLPAHIETNASVT